MDKKKVLILGNGRHGDISSWVAKALGEMVHLDIEQIDTMDGPLRGLKDGKSLILICDEMTSLAGAEFSALEERMLGLYDAVFKDGVGMYNTATGQTITGRQMFREPEPQRLPRTQVQQDIFEMLLVQTGRKVAQDWCEYTQVKQVPADHPIRKREPKGPRGKWGKL